MLITCPLMKYVVLRIDTYLKLSPKVINGDVCCHLVACMLKIAPYCKRAFKLHSKRNLKGKISQVASWFVVVILTGIAQALI